MQLMSLIISTHNCEMSIALKCCRVIEASLHANCLGIALYWAHCQAVLNINLLTVCHVFHLKIDGVETTSNMPLQSLHKYNYCEIAVRWVISDRTLQSHLLAFQLIYIIMDDANSGMQITHILSSLSYNIRFSIYHIHSFYSLFYCFNSYNANTYINL